MTDRSFLVEPERNNLVANLHFLTAFVLHCIALAFGLYYDDRESY